MSTRTFDPTNRSAHDTQSVNLALSSYEQRLFRSILERQAPEKAQDTTANDRHISALFTTLS